MAGFLIGLGGGILVILVAWIARSSTSRAPAVFPDVAKPAREVLVEHLADDLDRIEKALDTENPEAALADLINEALE